MKAKEQSEKGPREKRPQIVEGKVFLVRCKACDFEKMRRHYGDANFFAKQHRKNGHEIVIDQIDEPAPKQKAATAKATHPKKKEQSKS